jgi:dihydroflavonol-4-reductase
LTEAHWNDLSSLTRNPYFFSKAEAEKAAWRFVEQNEPSFKLVSVLPGAVYGRSHTPAVNQAVVGVLGLLKGEVPLLDAWAWFCDAEDVAEVHVAAAENPNSEGRYIVCCDNLSPIEMADQLKECYEPFNKPTKVFPSWLIRTIAWFLPAGSSSFIRTNVGQGKWTVSHEKVEKELGVKIKPTKAVLQTLVDDFIKWGHLPNPKA